MPTSFDEARLVLFSADWALCVATGPKPGHEVKILSHPSLQPLTLQGSETCEKRKKQALDRAEVRVIRRNCGAQHFDRHPVSKPEMRWIQRMKFL